MLAKRLDALHTSDLFISVSIPKAGSNMLAYIMESTLNKHSTQCCNEKWRAPTKFGRARESIYCAEGGTIKNHMVQQEVSKWFGKTCHCLASHADFSISLAPVFQKHRVHYITVLREPMSRLISACKYDKGDCSESDVVTLARINRGYGNPNRMTKMIAGVDPTCNLDSKSTTDFFLQDSNKEALLARAKSNLQHNFLWFGILERLDEALALLPDATNVSREKHYPKMEGRLGTFRGDKGSLEPKVRQYIDLDLQLYAFANQLLDKRLANIANSKLKYSD